MYLVSGSSPGLQIRLSSGQFTGSHVEGRLELLESGQWSSVCKTGFGVEEARYAVNHRLPLYIIHSGSLSGSVAIGYSETF